MPSWNDGDESSDGDIMGGNLMDMEYFDTPDTVPEPLWCGAPMEEVAKCTLHQMMPRKCVAFEGDNARRRFYGCPVQGGVNYGVVKWVDPVHPDILKNCLIKLWELFHEQNLGRIQDKNAYDAELAKLKKEKDHLCEEFPKMVDENLRSRMKS
ncbi:uncharacterized protein [Aegilops tauschii subsp. strangulata]|uniref:uncharacterized protein n=1 Tax=Aegilops tauschii subsp. strangulata TaxID=200361 RepID=UPI00098B7684|nr:uncharacterized protein LOC109779322 [Aegilops tauschii subsp. strangulata]